MSTTMINSINANHGVETGRGYVVRLGKLRGKGDYPLGLGRFSDRAEAEDTAARYACGARVVRLLTHEEAKRKFAAAELRKLVAKRKADGKRKVDIGAVITRADQLWTTAKQAAENRAKLLAAAEAEAKRRAEQEKARAWLVAKEAKREADERVRQLAACDVARARRSPAQWAAHARLGEPEAIAWMAKRKAKR